jgi:hypothetical protein
MLHVDQDFHILLPGRARCELHFRFYLSHILTVNSTLLVVAGYHASRLNYGSSTACSCFVRSLSSIALFNANLDTKVPYTAFAVMNFVWRINYINEKGVCIIGMDKIALMPLIIFEVIVNVSARPP